ncbi:hypothetical protein Vadar_009369 [Vaccinium darrowii]|uniref:Uncharacterized protein n=1 Tax=Vaccinium darrowii TaxID=229202 RepID=A0ACB7YLG5_9ERIC|nr:hypothetical protein Vadar_009369 [Vaccinium darrowii]
MSMDGGAAAAGGQIFVLTSVGYGHLFPSIELSHHLSSQNYTTTIILPSNLLPSLPLSLLPLQPSPPRRLNFPLRFSPPSPERDHANHQAGLDLSAHLEAGRPLCAVVDFHLDWAKPILDKFNVPVVSFFTFGACAAAMERVDR